MNKRNVRKGTVDTVDSNGKVFTLDVIEKQVGVKTFGSNGIDWTKADETIEYMGEEVTDLGGDKYEVLVMNNGALDSIIVEKLQ